MGVKQAARRAEYRQKLERMAAQPDSPEEAAIARRKLEDLKVKREAKD